MARPTVDAMGVLVGNGRTFGADSGVGSTRALIEARLPAVREQRTRLEEELAAVIAQENAMVSVLQGLAALSDALLGEGEQAQAPAPVQPAGGEPAGTEKSAEPVEAVDHAPAAAKKAVKKTTEKKAAAKRAAPRKTAARKEAAAGKGRAAKKTADDTSAVGAPGQDADQAPAPVAQKTAPRRAAKTSAAGAGPARGKTAAKTTAKPETPEAAGKSTRAKTAPAAGQTAKEPSKRRRRLTDADSVLAVLRQTEQPLRAREVTERLGLADTDGAVDAIRTRLERLTSDAQVKRTGRGLYTSAD
ncbi:hypothetical protein [Kitasatospora camelliae]|uniref:Prephenate dehydrogenase n=1 Tax=Kitasatospora camelliae TaxID=3156397 RepID=A0AAU8K5T8_9ACTN